MNQEVASSRSGQLSLPVQLDDSATFANFFIPESKINAAILATIEHDLTQSVYLWGSAGAGVSHLLQAACRQISLGGRRAIYLPLKEFDEASPRDVLEDLENMDLVCIDDVDSLSGKSEWAEQLFHLFNRAQASGCRLLFGAKVSPSNIDTSLADVKSRLSSLLVHRVEALPDREIAQALIFRARRRGMAMPKTVAEYLLTRYSRKSADQFDALDRLDKSTLVEKRALTVPFVKMVLEATADE